MLTGEAKMKKIYVFIFACAVMLSVVLPACAKKMPSEPVMPSATSTPTPTVFISPTITNTPVLDIYEPDDSPADANPATVGAPGQLHNFYNFSDWDYVTFDGTAGVNYLVRAVNVNGSVMPISLQEANGAAEYSWSDGQQWAYMPIFCLTGTTYIIRAADASGISGLNTDYELDVITLPAVTAIDFNSAVDNGILVFSFEGTGTWVGQSDYSYSGGSAVQSPHLANVQHSGFSADVTGPCTVKFWWKVSSESCCDALTFAVDAGSTAYLSISGQHDWAQETVVITGAGTHTLKWLYSKDTTIACGYDMAWVDKIEIIP
jgi:hypothetical protein